MGWINVRIDDELHKDIKRLAVDKGETMDDTVKTILEKGCEHCTNGSQRR